jgi:hypothetical protein
MRAPGERHATMLPVAESHSGKQTPLAQEKQAI